MKTIIKNLISFGTILIATLITTLISAAVFGYESGDFFKTFAMVTLLLIVYKLDEIKLKNES